MTQIKDVAAQMKLESSAMAASSAEQRNDALVRIKEALVANSEKIFSEERNPEKKSRKKID